MYDVPIYLRIIARVFGMMTSMGVIGRGWLVGARPFSGEISVLYTRGTGATIGWYRE